MRRLDCHNRIKEVKSNHQIALKALNLLIAIVTARPQYLYDNDLSLVTIRVLLEELNDSYFVKLFACFESSLRHYWRNMVKDTKPQTEVLLFSIAARCGIPKETLDAVQKIRDFRNHLLHEEHEIVRGFTIDEASSHLNTYLARLPLEW